MLLSLFTFVFPLISYLANLFLSSQNTFSRNEKKYFFCFMLGEGGYYIDFRILPWSLDYRDKVGNFINLYADYLKHKLTIF